MASPPTDIVIACCRDEADIIGSFISFYVDQGFDAICLVDNGSRDDTVREIKRHPARDRIRLHCDPRVGYDGRLMEYNRLFSPLASRWIFFLDVDEFIVIPGGIKTYAEQLPLDCSILEMATFEMIPDTATVAPEPLLAVRRESQLTEERKVVWKVGIPQLIYCGKHAIGSDQAKPYQDPALYIRHFHTRSERQFRSKLQNRVETETTLSSSAEFRDVLSFFDSTERREWLEESRGFLEADGWTREKERLAEIPWVEDTEIRDWYRRRGSAPQILMAADRPGGS
jgi:hypothetical protein